MPILDAALAFALTMLVVSTCVTAIVSGLQTLAKTRKKVMKDMLEKYYTTELQPVIQREMIRLKGSVDEATASEVKKLAGEINTPVLFNQQEIENLVEASTSEIIERLKRSPLGTELMTKLGHKADAVFNELANRYEAIGDKFTVSFRSNSKWWAMGIALALALALNIDSIFIMDSYIKDQGLRNAVVAQRDSIEQDYNDLVSSIPGPEDTVSRKDIEAAFKESQSQVTTLTSIGLPIGWTYFPHVALKDNKAEAYTSRASLRGWIFWGLGILLTGGLAGLGGPFWYDAVGGVSRAADVARKKKQE